MLIIRYFIQLIHSFIALNNYTDISTVSLKFLMKIWASKLTHLMRNSVLSFSNF